MKTLRWGIMHGDNSGLYAACIQLANMFESIKEPEKAWPNTNKSKVSIERYRNFEKQIKNKENE